LGRCHSSPAARETQGNRRQDTGSQLHRKRSPRRPTLQLRGRRRAKRDGNRRATLFGAPLELRVGRPPAKHHDRYCVRGIMPPGLPPHCC
jgi:hypothetical protein